jgi:Zn-dependent peptidase ImmA (M78 family)/DNA-binding XRE family transcriptional regulator
VEPVRPRAVQPARLRLARQLRGLRQRDLAIQIDVTPAAVSQFESGASEPGSETLERIAMVLGCTPQFFLRPITAAGPTGEPFFRSRRNTPGLERDRARAFAQILSEIAATLERSLELPPLQLRQLRSLDVDSPVEEAEEIAIEVRRGWGLEDGPIANVVNLLESKGAIAAAVGSFDRRLDAFSIRTNSRPVVILCSDGGKAARRRFDAAHELGHLLLHELPAEANRTQEDQAHRFASALLMPYPAIKPWLPQRVRDLERLEEGSRVWGVSMQALLYRARQVKVLSESAFTESMRRLSAAGWRRQEPVDIGPAEAPQLLKLAAKQLGHSGRSIESVAAELGFSPARLRRMLSVPEERDTQPDNVVQLKQGTG